MALTFPLKFFQHIRKEVNVELKKEAEFFGDIVVVPYLDNYDLVVLKTVSICEYGVSFLINMEIQFEYEYAVSIKIVLLFTASQSICQVYH